MTDRTIEALDAAERCLRSDDRDSALLWVLVAKKHLKTAEDNPLIERRGQPIDTRATARA